MRFPDFRKQPRAAAAASAAAPPWAANPPPAPPPVPAALPPGSPPAASSREGAPPAPVPDRQVDAVAQGVAELDQRVQSVLGAMDTLHRETEAIGQRVKEGDEKFVRLLAILEGPGVLDNPFLERGGDGQALGPGAAPGRGADAAPPAEAPPVLAGGATADYHRPVLLMEWAEMLLDAVERPSVGHLLDWYQSLGWIDHALKEEVMLYAKGIHAAADESVPKAEVSRPRSRAATQEVAHWRQEVELHMRSLAFIARLRGGAAPDDLEEALRQALAIRAA